MIYPARSSTAAALTVLLHDALDEFLVAVRALEEVVRPGCLPPRDHTRLYPQQPRLDVCWVHTSIDPRARMRVIWVNTFFITTACKEKISGHVVVKWKNPRMTYVSAAVSMHAQPRCPAQPHRQQCHALHVLLLRVPTAHSPAH